MKIVKTKMTLEEQAELEYANSLKEKLETQSLLIQYVAEMSDIYIPEEEDYVQNTDEIKG